MFLGVWCLSQSLSLANLACAARSDSRDTSFVHLLPLRDEMPTRLEAQRCAMNMRRFRRREKGVCVFVGAHVHVHVRASHSLLLCPSPGFPSSFIADMLDALTQAGVRDLELFPGRERRG
jgi:hypothetical protein